VIFRFYNTIQYKKM